MISQSNNVVLFPKDYKDGPLQSLEEIKGRIAENRMEHISYLVEDITEYVFQRAELEGFHISSDECINSTMLFIESLKAALYRAALLEHPLHKLADDVMVVDTAVEEID